MALIACTWVWGDKYGEHYVKKLAAGVHRNLTEGHHFLCFTDTKRHLPGMAQIDIPEEDRHLLGIPGCFARLRIFDPVFQEKCGIKPGDRIVNIDLDSVVVGPLDPLFAGDAGFSILQGINTNNLCPFNGSLWMLRAGYRPDVWSSFSLEAAAKMPKHEFADDQGWFHHMMPDAAAYGPDCGVYGFKKLRWPSGDALPDNARLVAFPGWRDPSKFEHLNWIKEHWRY